MTIQTLGEFNINNPHTATAANILLFDIIGEKRPFKHPHAFGTPKVARLKRLPNLVLNTVTYCAVIR